MQKRQFHEDGQADHISPCFANKFDRGSGRAAGCEYVVDDDHAIGRGQRILVNFERTGAVLKFVFAPMHIAGKLAGLAKEYETAAQFIRKGSTQRESSRLDADDHRGLLRSHCLSPSTHGQAKSDGISENAEQIFERDAWRREVGHHDDFVPQCG